MPIHQDLLAEFDHEMASTRRTLERVPEDKFDWVPHQKSAKLGALAKHLAELPSFATMTLQMESFDIAPDGKHVPSPPVRTRKEILALFDKSVVDARKALTQTMTDAELSKKFSLLATGKPIFSLPRTEVLRVFLMNHLIHHRAQLGVYLRLNDIAVPSIYGPSADEGGM